MVSPVVPRRKLLLLGAAAAESLGCRPAPAPASAPAVITAARARPRFPSGVQSGDVDAGRGIIWARSDRPARLWVEWATTTSFSNVRRVRGPIALEATDYSARVDLTGLPAGQDIFYRVVLEDLAGGGTSEPMTGHLRTAPSEPRTLRFLWSGDTAGQGFGISQDFGGLKIYETMRRQDPDFFLHCGDTIYADVAIPEAVPLGDGRVWRNLVTEEKSKVAETLAEFRGNYRYNMLDEHVRRFNREVMQIWQWDDHEIANNWSPGKSLLDDVRYAEKSVPLLVARGTRAFLENAPMRWHAQDEEERVYRKVRWGPLLDVFVVDTRSYRGPNTHNRQTSLDAESRYLGSPQLDWLTQALAQSQAVWKVIASDMPIALMVGDGVDGAARPRFDGAANGPGPVLGRELEIATLLSFIKQKQIKNTVWLTADVHYTAAHHYHPNRAKFQDFEPFWEFVSGPLHAGSFGAKELDDTFGPKLEFVKAPAADDPRFQSATGVPPTAGMQFFGEVVIDGTTAAMTVHLRDLTGASLWSTTLEPILRGRPNENEEPPILE